MAVDVLVTGAVGALGRQVVNSLRAADMEVIACGRRSGEGIDAEWDISTGEAPEPNCKPRVVVHAAASMGGYQQALTDALPLFDVNVSGTMRVMRWCMSQDVERVILISGAIVYGEWADSPKTETDAVNPAAAGPYAVSKWCAEQVAALVTNSGIVL